jgi:hypothetical protein
LLQPDKESDPIPKKPMEEKSSSKEESPDLDLNLNSQYILETLPYGFVYQDSSGKIKYANGSAQRILGFTQRQISGKTSLDPDWMAIQEDGSPFLGEAHPSLQALKTGKSFSKVIMGVFNPMQQKYVWISINAVPIQIEESELPIGVYVTFEDVNLKSGGIVFESDYFEIHGQTMDNKHLVANQSGEFDMYGGPYEPKMKKPEMKLDGKDIYSKAVKAFKDYGWDSKEIDISRTDIWGSIVK